MKRIKIEVHHVENNIELKVAGGAIAPRTIQEEWSKGEMLPSVEALTSDAKDSLFELLKSGSGDRSDLAQHLLNVLIDPGQQADVFGTGPGPRVDLAIEMDFDDPLAAIPWELVLSAKVGSKTLAQLGATVTRLVRSEAPAPVPFERPIKVLFVSGTPIDDPAVKAGTEFYCIARNFTLGKRPFRTRLVVHASLDELVAAAKELEPHVIHFAGHGEFGAAGASIQLRDPTPGSDFMRVTPEQLIAELKGILPTMMILSACQTGNTQPFGAGETASFAAQLVKGGIPIVAAMAGKITDLATRTFTRSLMTALVNGEPIVEVTGMARQKVFNEVNASGEWIYPGLFCAPSVPVNFTIGSAQVTEEEERLQKRIDRFVETDRFEPHLCLRENVWAAYANVLNGKALPSLHIFGGTNMGKSRILRELARQAVREGHLAIGISPDFVTGASDTTSLRIAGAFLQALNFAVADLGIGEEVELEYMVQASRQNINEIPPPPGTKSVFRNRGQEIRKVAAVFEFELQRILELAIEKGLLPPTSKPIVFIDDLHKMPEEFLQTLFLENGTVHLNGWAIIGTNPIPFFSTSDMSELAKVYRAAFGEKCDFVEIGPFAMADDADILAYERILMNPFHRPSCKFKDADKVFALTEKFFTDTSGDADDVRDNFRVHIRHDLINLKLPGLYAAARVARAAEYMTSSTENALLQALGMWEAK
ncbi:MAG: CHAT domain-containing protein [Armatimonadetes bacterium]|nr:CHAT domain-containing protein [Armatimonadota bacterium]